MSRKVFKKIGLSTAVFATGLFLWANVATGSTTQVQYNETSELTELPCLPGYPDWPECAPKQKDSE